MNVNDIFYPGLIICGLLIVGGLVIFATTSWLFKVTDGRLRRCPNCERKGAGYITHTDTIESNSHMDFKGRTAVRVTNEAFEDHYECEHCGHTWMIPFSRTTREKRKSQRTQQTSH